MARSGGWADPVENAPGLVAWNTDKRYLAELAGRGVPVIPTRFLNDPGEVDGEDLRELAVASAALAAVPGDPLYARVDLVRLEDGSPAVIEVELAEPAFFCGLSPGSADRFAAAVFGRLLRA